MVPFSSEVLYNFFDSYSVGSLSDTLLVLEFLLLSLSFAVSVFFLCLFFLVFVLTMIILLDFFCRFSFCLIIRMLHSVSGTMFLFSVSLCLLVSESTCLLTFFVFAELPLACSVFLSEGSPVQFFCTDESFCCFVLMLFLPPRQVYIFQCFFLLLLHLLLVRPPE